MELRCATARLESERNYRSNLPYANLEGPTNPSEPSMETASSLHDRVYSLVTLPGQLRQIQKKRNYSGTAWICANRRTYIPLSVCTLHLHTMIGWFITLEGSAPKSS